METLPSNEHMLYRLKNLRNPLGWTGALVIACAMALSACGGGKTDAPVVTPPVSLASVEGIVVVSEDSSVLANAKVSVGAISTTTAADGQFTLSNIAPAARGLIKIEADGFVDGFVSLALVAGQKVRVSPRLQRASAPSLIDPTSNATVTADGSIAQVILPANSLVNEVTGAVATGTVTARVTAINPAADPQTMPGDYSVSDTVRIESFGAVKVTLRDADGKKVNLKSGSKATIRIPLATRSANPPANIPLFYFNESTGRWVEEGSATLSGTAPNQYYEGQVSHFSYWNADQVQDTIYVNGCLVDASSKPLIGAMVQTVGIDYSGTANDVSDNLGKFRVAIRKGGRATLSVEFAAIAGAIVVGPSLTDITLSSCLVISGATALPVILEQPQNLTIDPGWPVYFYVVASGSISMKYQWQRNGVNIIGATSSWYFGAAQNTSDNGAIYTVVVSNAAGSVTSSPAVLTVNPPVAPSILVPPVSTTVFVGQTATFSALFSGMPAPTYQWKRNGVNIDGATGFSYTTPVLALSDSGTLYSVVATNSQGSAASSAATLTVNAGNSASTDEKFKLMRLLSLTFDFYEAASLPGRLMNEDGSVFLNPANVCESGSISGSFNGGTLPVEGTVVPNSATLAATASACLVDGSAYTGSSSITFTITPGNPKLSSATALVNNMRVHTNAVGVDSPEKDFTANGGGSSNFTETTAGSDTTTQGTWTPNAGATIRSEISGLTATFVSGNTGFLTVSQPSVNQPYPNTTQLRMSYNNMKFAVAGISYVANGFYELKFGTQPGLPFTGSGEITLSANGVRIGRIFATNAGVFIEVDGVVQAF